MPNRNSYGAPKLIYRFDRRSPEEIFQDGFNAWGTNLNFFEHILGAARGDHLPIERRTGIIAASDSPDSAIRFFGASLTQPGVPGSGYLYEIRADENVYSAQRTGSFYQERLNSGNIRFAEGDARTANNALRLLNTVFANQREWFSITPIPGNRVRSAWRLDSVPIIPSHLQHQYFYVHYTPRINEPEILNSNYVDEDTYANHLPFTAGASYETVSTNVTVPQVVEESDASGGTIATLGFACSLPSHPSRKKRDLNESIDCYFPNGRELRYDLKTQKYDAELSEATKTPLYLIGEQTHTQYLLDCLDLNNSYEVSLVNVHQNKKLLFIYNSFHNLCFFNTKYQMEFALTPIKQDRQDIYELNYLLATTNNESQQWKLTLFKDDKQNNCAWYQLRNISIKDFTLHRHIATNKLVLMHKDDKLSGYEQMLIHLSDTTTNELIVLAQNSRQKFVDLQLAWLYQNQYYIPVPKNNYSVASRPVPYQFFYDLNTYKILFIDQKYNVSALKNIRDKNRYDWDWINWSKSNILPTNDPRLKWYFRNQEWKDIQDGNFRNIMSFYENDYLRVVLRGANWGSLYTTKFESDKNSIALFSLSETADI